MNKKAPSIPLMALLVLGLLSPAFGQQTESRSGYENIPQFGGPNSVGGQVKSDDEVRKTPYWFEGLSQTVQPYYDFKARVQKNHGLSFGADYNMLYQDVSESLGEDNAAGGVLEGSRFADLAEVA